MRIPSGMERKPIALAADQQAVHQIPGQKVDAVVLKGLGDGWVEYGEHLAGTSVQKRIRGHKTIHEFVPVDNVLLEAEQVDKQISDELASLVGYNDVDGSYVEGELDQIRSAHGQLAFWLTLTPEEKQDIDKVYADIADVRDGATNLFNLSAGSVAKRAHELNKNPGAVRASTLKLEKLFLERHGELVKNLSINDQRTSRFRHEWLFEENRVLTQCYGILERLLLSQSDDDLDSLRLMVPNLHFRHRPFNAMASEIAQTGWRVEDEQVVINALAALQFERFNNFLLSPFRRITASPKRRRTNVSVPVEQEPIPEALQRRITALESMEAPGATGRLVDRLIPLGRTVLQATLRGEKDTAVEAGKAFKWLVNYHCEAVGDPELEVWYSRQLR